MTLTAPVTYQGGKSRLAQNILECMKGHKEPNFSSNTPFYELCCGSGAVSLALVESGHSPSLITMVDQGPWGWFWKSIGEGSFHLEIFKNLCDAVPRDPKEIKSCIEHLYRSPVGHSGIYTFLLLQAAAIGGKSIDIENNKWVRGSGFRDYWLPTETSSRRSPVNPMMPMPNTIIERVTEIVRRMRGVTGICGDAMHIFIKRNETPSIVYIDPQYEGTTGYSYKIDAVAVAKRIANEGDICWVSEGKPLSDKAIKLSDGRAKGGITGERKKAANEEWLSYFGP